MTSSMEPPENCGVTRKTPVVMKFGGSSLADAEMLVRVCNIVKQKIEREPFEVPVLVCSAMGKTTNKLVEIWTQLQQDLAARSQGVLELAAKTNSNESILQARQLAHSKSYGNMHIGVPVEEESRTKTARGAQDAVPKYRHMLSKLESEHSDHFWGALVFAKNEVLLPDAEGGFSSSSCAPENELENHLHEEARKWWQEQVRPLFAELREKLDASYASAKPSPVQNYRAPVHMPSFDEVSAYGERLSIRILTFVMKNALNGDSNHRNQSDPEQLFADQNLSTAIKRCEKNLYIPKFFDSWDMGLRTSAGTGDAETAHSSCIVDVADVFPKMMQRFAEERSRTQREYNSLSGGKENSKASSCEDTAPQDGHSLGGGAEVPDKKMVRNFIPVITGFIAQDHSGRITTLGRDGSDYSASLFGAGLGACRVQIYKEDVCGVLTTDPRTLIKDVSFYLEDPWQAGGVVCTHPVDQPQRENRVKPLSFLTYEQAAELATFGASVVHPRAMEPLRIAGITMEVRNTRDPFGKCTIIGPKFWPGNTNDSVSKAPEQQARMTKSGVLAITTNARPQLLKVSSSALCAKSGYLHTVGYLANVFRILSEADVSVDVVATSTTSLSITTDGDSKSVANLAKAKARLLSELGGGDDAKAVRLVSASGPTSEARSENRAEKACFEKTEKNYSLDGSQGAPDFPPRQKWMQGQLHETSEDPGPDDLVVSIDPDVGTVTLILESPAYTQRIMKEALQWMQQNDVPVKVVTQASDLQVTFVVGTHSKGLPGQQQDQKENGTISNVVRTVDALHRMFIEY